MLVLETLGAPPPPRRRRRRPREADAGSGPTELPLTRATAVRAFAPFSSAEEAQAWLREASAEDGSLDPLLGEATEMLNRALHVQAVASGDPNPQSLSPTRAAAARIGYGSGEEVAHGDFTEALDVDVRSGSSRRQQRSEELRPQARLAAVLGGRENLDACETLLLRARADLDADRNREAALQLRVGLESLLAELGGALSEPGHEEDMAAIEARRHEAGEMANAALGGELGDEQLDRLRELLDLCERVLRRRRVLRG